MSDLSALEKLVEFLDHITDPETMPAEEHEEFLEAAISELETRLAAAQEMGRG